MQFRSYVTHVVVTTLILFTRIGYHAKPVKQKQVYCDPENHQYYNNQVQGCKECDRCWSGEEPDLKGADVGMGPNGATKCPRCRECSDGTYNPDGDKYWNCLTCTVCSDLGMHEVQACLPTQNTKCNETAQIVNKRLVPRVSDSQENVQERPIHEGEKSHTKENVMIGVATGVSVLVMFVIYNKRKRICQKCKENQAIPDTEERTPLHTIEPNRSEEEQADSSDLHEVCVTNDADDRLCSLKDIHKKETLPLLPKRQRYHSSGDYVSTRYGFDKNVEKDEKELAGRRNPGFHRQLSHPVTDMEVGITEQQLDNKRPSQKCVHVLSKLLAPNQKFKKFANYMGIEKHQIDLMEEEHKERNFSAEDWSYEYISKVLQCQPKLSYHDIYKALKSLELYEEFATLHEKRRRTYM